MRRLLADRKIDLQLSGRAKRWLADKGFDTVYGARPLKRTIQRALQDPLALKILSGAYGDGDVVSVDANEDGLTFASGERVAEAA